MTVTAVARQLSTQLDALVNSQYELSEQIRHIVYAQRQRCICGYATPDLAGLNRHRAECTLLRVAAIGDIIRVANLLGRTPTNAEYCQHRCTDLPGWSTLCTHVFDTWTDAVDEARLKPLQRHVKKRAAEAVR